jgi:hypothetical protein
MGGRFGVAWRAERCDAERTCGVRLAELAPPFDSANPAKLAAIARTRLVRAGLALERWALTAADPCDHRALSRHQRPRLQLFTFGYCRASVSDASSRQIDWHFTEWSRGAASDNNGRLIRVKERKRVSQTPYKSAPGSSRARVRGGPKPWQWRRSWCRRWCYRRRRSRGNRGCRCNCGRSRSRRSRSWLRL